MSTPVHILGISGSLRRASHNSGLLRAAAAAPPVGVTIEIADLHPLPFYDGDVEAIGLPDTVVRFRDQIASADALLIATPEYNFSISGVLKNAIDWASRPDFSVKPTIPSPLVDKPYALMGAGGRSGTALAQLHFRQIGIHNDMKGLPKPEVLFARQRDRFDADGDLTDPDLRAEVVRLVEALAAWTRRLRGG